MNNIAIIGSESYTNVNKISQLYSYLKKNYGTYCTINTGGNKGAEYIAKKLALELNMSYKEFNPSYTVKNMYSAMGDEYYGKNYHYSHMMDRYKHLIRSCDYIIAYIDPDSKPLPDLAYAITLATKYKKRIKIIN